MKYPVLLLSLLFSIFTWPTSSKSSDSSVSSTSTNESTTSTSSDPTSTSFSSSDESTSDSDTFGNGRKHPPFEIFLPYRMDFLAEMKLTTIFPRKFLYTLSDYKRSKNSGVPVLSMPNYSSGAMRLGAVYLPSRGDMNNFLAMMEELSRRVYRTGLNKSTAGGNFRLPIRGLAIDPATRLVYTKIDSDFPTDSHGRYIKFMKSLYHRLAKSRLRYEIDEEIQLDRIVLGMVDNLADIDLKAFEKTFKDFQVGFLTISKVVVRPPGRNGDRYKSIFYFDHSNYEPIIGIENTVEGEEAHAINEALYAEASGAVKKDTKKKSKSKSKSSKNKSKNKNK